MSIRRIDGAHQVAAEAVEDCIFAQCYPNVMEGAGPLPVGALDAGLTTSTGG